MTTRTNNRIGLGNGARRGALMMTLAAGLAVTAVGCANNGTRSANRANNNSYANRLASNSNVSIDPAATVGRYDANWYAERANQSNLPPLWLGEAVQATADAQQARAQAIATRVARQASENAELAQAQARLRAAMGDEQIAVADADGLRAAIDARIAEMTTGVSATERGIESEARLNDALVRSMVQDRQAQFEAMRSQAMMEFEQSQAEHERMIAQRQAVERDGNAEIGKMTKIADLTEARAASKVTALRTQAESVQRQTEARLADLTQQIQSLTEQIGAESARLRTAAASLEDEGKATSSELRAKADALSERDAEQEFGVRINAAQTTLTQAKSSFTEAQQQADAMMQESKAATERLRADAERFRLVSDADFQQQLAATTRFKEHNLAEVFVQRARASQIEKASREEFVKAQAEAIAQAQREEAAHLDQLAQKQFEQIKAQAEADAAAIRAELIARLAQQMAANSTELPGKTDGQPGVNKNNPNSKKQATAPGQPGAEPVTAQSPAPQQPDVPAKPAVIEPEHVAAFKSALAEATRLRAQADAKEQSVLATFQERTQKLNAWRNQQESRHEQMMAEIGAFEQQAAVRAAAIREKAEKTLRLAQAEHDSATAEATAFRMDTQAKITTLRAEAQRIFEHNTAEATRLFAQAEAVDAGGAAEVRALTAQRDATQRRGAAEARSLFAEADAIENSQRALVAQMRQEVNSAQRILASELARLDQTANSFIQIAQATFDEAATISDTFAEKTRIASDRMTIDNEVVRKMAQAEVSHQRNIVNAHELSGQAEVERRIAQATAGREIAESEDLARRASVYAQSQVVEAATRVQLATADAKDENIRSIFDSRVASVQADRDRAFAENFLSTAQRNARLAKAQAAAAAYRDISNAAIAMLNDKQAAFERAAKINWDARLAMPAGAMALEWPTLDPNFVPPFPNEPITPPAFANVIDDFDNN